MGGSSRPAGPASYSEDEFAADALAALDAAGVEQAVVVALSLGAQRALILAGEHPDRVRGQVLRRGPRGRHARRAPLTESYGGGRE
jgi:pimeloyl-ACP methyl ester carboxylesterase